MQTSELDSANCGTAKDARAASFLVGQRTDDRSCTPTAQDRRQAIPQSVDLYMLILPLGRWVVDYREPGRGAPGAHLVARHSRARLLSTVAPCRHRRARLDRRWKGLPQPRNDR